ncbi:MAG: nicotinamide mononucleotide transporter [Clostridiales bacterium]|nr:nicotinamide mononucleotide transporter [Clostridiales bacterium]
MNILSVIKSFSNFERFLWIFSLISVTCAFILAKSFDFMILSASLIGVTALIFIAKGNVWGQILTLVFSVLYAVISYRFDYFGEMITYLGMTAPVAFLSILTWLKNPYSVYEIKVNSLSKFMYFILFSVTLGVTFIFYFILKFFGTANLGVSTLSVATSFMASTLMMFRSPYYAVAYALNDLVLIILWCMASFSDVSYAPMTVCFFIFLANDLYGFKNWKAMRKRQRI